MKKSADSNNTTTPPVLCFYTPKVPIFISDHLLAQNLISVFLEFIKHSTCHKSIQSALIFAIIDTKM